MDTSSDRVSFPPQLSEQAPVSSTTEQNSVRRGGDTEPSPSNIWYPSSASQSDAIDTSEHSRRSSLGSLLPSLRRGRNGTSSSRAWRQLLPPTGQKHRANRSTTSVSSTATSQPVIVRTYSGPGPGSKTSTTYNPSTAIPSNYPPSRTNNMRAPSSSERPQSTKNPKTATLPNPSDFSIANILTVISPEISTALDAIAAICARSNLSLASEHSSHLPPQGEILARGGTQPNGLMNGDGAGVGTGKGLYGRSKTSGRAGEGEDALSVVLEASSSSERLAGESPRAEPRQSWKRGHAARSKSASWIFGPGRQDAAGGDGSVRSKSSGLLPTVDLSAGMGEAVSVVSPAGTIAGGRKGLGSWFSWSAAERGGVVADEVPVRWEHQRSVSCTAESSLRGLLNGKTKDASGVVG